MNKEVYEKIDYQIKRSWMTNVANDYRDDYILKEDSLKNAFYHHLRCSLDPLFKENNLRIFTEFNESGLKAKGYRADIAIVELGSENATNYLGNDVKNVVAIIELKFLGIGSNGTDLILQDVEKTKNYIKSFSFTNCQYYLGMIHEHKYPISELHWLSNRQSNTWAKGKVTELNACYFIEHEGEEIGFSVSSYNGFNMELNCESLEDIRFVSMI